MSKPTLLYCIGATKAGTSWLHRYISNHPDCHMRGIKELHYFDALEFDDWTPWINMIAKRRDLNRRDADRIEDKHPDRAANKRRVALDADAWLHVLERRERNDAAYLSFLTEGLRGHAIIGDFTPAYSLLSADRLRHMAGLAQKTQFVYILRDPVQRIWSHCRMMAGRRAKDPSEIPGRSVNIMRRVIKGKEPEIVRRSDYAGPMQRLKEAVPPEDLYIDIYEDLFNRDAIARLSKFLGISHGWADFEKRVLAGPQVKMEPGQWQEMREFLAPQYEAMQEMLGTLPDSWGKQKA